MPIFAAEDLRTMTGAVFEAAGFPTDKARLIARLMVESNLVGHDSHGVRHIPIYVSRVRDGLIRPEAEPRIVEETATTAVVDGEGTLGHVAATFGLELAIEKARQNRISAVAVHNEEHVGRVGGYPEMAARAGMVGITLCNGQGRGVSIAPFGGTDRRLGANPFTAAFPNPDGDPILLDMSTSAVAVNKVRQAKDRQAALPEGAILGPDGLPSTDPDDFLKNGGAVLPLGGLLYGHKGFGLAVIIDMFCGILGGSGTARHQDDAKLNNGTFHIVLDPGAFIQSEQYANEVKAYTEYLHASRTLPGDPAVKLPGEFEEQNRKSRSANGVSVEEPVWRNICETLARLNVPPPEPIG
jgi:uncharacterized oxidoreductase